MDPFDVIWEFYDKERSYDDRRRDVEWELSEAFWQTFIWEARKVFPRAIWTEEMFEWDEEWSEPADWNESYGI